MFELNPILFSLPNGIRVVYQKREAFVAHLGVMIGAGSRYELEDEEGLAHFIEHSIFKGTNKRKALDIFTDLDSVGGELNAYTNKEEICVHASFRRIHFDIAVELLSDIVWNASFPENEIEIEKEVVIDEINSYLDSPMERIFDEFEAHLFKGSSLGYNTLGTKESVKGFTREKLLSYVERHFTPDNMVISFVGDIQFEVVKQTLEAHFGQIHRKNGALTVFDAKSYEPFKLVERKANFQTHTVIGGLAPSYNDDAKHAMSLMINVLGGPALNSRLTLSIREKYGYAYNIEASYSPYTEVGFWTVYMGTDKKHLEKAVALIYEELELMRQHGIGRVELEQAKEQLKGHIALSLDSNLDLMFSLAKNSLIHEKVHTLKEVYDRIDKITEADILSVARRYFAPDQIAELIFKF